MKALSFAVVRTSYEKVVRTSYEKEVSILSKRSAIKTFEINYYQ
jgi:hypothetical protein